MCTQLNVLLFHQIIIISKQATGLLGHLLQNQVHDISFIIFHIIRKAKENNEFAKPPTQYNTVQWRSDFGILFYYKF